MQKVSFLVTTLKYSVYANLYEFSDNLSKEIEYSEPGECKMICCVTNETVWALSPVKTQIGLSRCPVLAMHLMCLSFLHANSEDGDQADLSHRWMQSPNCWFCQAGAPI